MDCLRDISINTLHKGGGDDDDNIIIIIIIIIQVLVLKIIASKFLSLLDKTDENLWIRGRNVQ